MRPCGCARTQQKKKPFFTHRLLFSLDPLNETPTQNHPPGFWTATLSTLIEPVQPGQQQAVRPRGRGRGGVATQPALQPESYEHPGASRHLFQPSSLLPGRFRRTDRTQSRERQPFEDPEEEE